MSNRDPIVAGILIGGQSTRMGASKANLPWRDATILETIVKVAGRITSECLLLGTSQQLPQSLGHFKQIPDPYPNLGPIAGLHALLSHHPNHWCLLLSCDIPNITTQTITTLIDRIVPHVEIIAYSLDHRLEPCCALYHATILPHVHKAITQHRYALHHLIQSLPHTSLPIDPATQHDLHNINTLEDYNKK